jgi:hypothetical protein
MESLEKSADGGAEHSILEDSQRRHSGGSFRTVSTTEVPEHRHSKVVVGLYRFCWFLAKLLDFYIKRARGDINNNARILEYKVLLGGLHILMIRVVKIKKNLDFRSLI